MSSTLSGQNPTSYLGVKATNPPQVIVAARAPLSVDINFDIGTEWINTVTSTQYVLTSIVNAVATWVNTGVLVNSISGTTTQMVNNNTYISNNAALSTFTLPLTANVGDQITVIGKGVAFWTIHQNALQQINWSTVSTTAGTGGSITSTEKFDTLTIECTVANTTWTVIAASSVIANYTIV